MLQSLSAVVVVLLIVLLLIILERKHKREVQKKRLLQYRSGILTAEDDFKKLLNRPRYFSKAEFNSWKHKWSTLQQIVAEYAGRPIQGIDFKESILNLHNMLTKGLQIVETRNRTFIAEELANFKDYFDQVDSIRSPRAKGDQ
jgi:hypothetical protein